MEHVNGTSGGLCTHMHTHAHTHMHMHTDTCTDIPLVSLSPCSAVMVVVFVVASG